MIFFINLHFDIDVCTYYLIKLIAHQFPTTEYKIKNKVRSSSYKTFYHLG